MTLAGAPVGQDEGLHQEGCGLRGGHRHEAARLLGLTLNETLYQRPWRARMSARMKGSISKAAGCVVGIGTRPRACCVLTLDKTLIAYTRGRACRPG